MTIKVDWVNSNQNIIHFEYQEPWTWEEAFESIQKSQQMLDAVNHPVATIVDLRDGQNIPPDPMIHMKQVVENRSSHINDSGITIFLDAEILTKAMLDFISMGNPEAAAFVSFKHSKTLEDSITQAEATLLAEKK